MPLLLRKYARLLSQPACWPALAQGVAATLEHDSALGREHFATVIDVGANKGQFAIDARQRWPQARLICFEPLPAPAPRAKLARVTCISPPLARPSLLEIDVQGANPTLY